MVDNTLPIRGVADASQGAHAKGRANSAGGPAFQALLEQLGAQAAGLRAAGEGDLEPQDLAGAVEDARASLEDAISLGDQLLEAYRAAQQRRETAQTDPE
jgi:hypothetical protein